MKKYKFTQNIGLKIMALLFAGVLWMIVVNVDDPVVSVVYRDVPVTITNEDVVTNKGKVYQIVDDTQKVNVTVYATRSIISKISKNNITAVADLSQMDVSTYLVPIRASVKEYESGIKSIETNPTNLQVELQDVTTKKFPVSVSTTGTPRNGYVVGDMTANPKEITIGGPESLVNSIAKVVASASISGISDSCEVEAELKCLDANGNVMDQTKLSNNLGDKGISIKIQMLNTKSVNLEFHVSGTPADGYSYTGYYSEPESVEVSGTMEVLENLSSIEIPAEEINIDGETGKKEFTVDILPYLPEGVALRDETANNVVVTVEIEQEGARTIELPVNSIQIKNLSDKLKIDFESDNNISLTFKGLAENLDKLDIKNAASIDLKNYATAGKYEVPVLVETASGVTLTEEPIVTVILTDKSEETEDEANTKEE